MNDDDGKRGRNIYDLLSEWSDGIFLIAFVFVMSLPKIIGHCE